MIGLFNGVGGAEVFKVCLLTSTERTWLEVSILGADFQMNILMADLQNGVEREIWFAFEPLRHPKSKPAVVFAMVCGPHYGPTEIALKLSELGRSIDFGSQLTAFRPNLRFRKHFY